MAEQRGRKPTDSEKVGFAAAETLAPDKSLERTRELAKFVFANVAVIGTLLTGLGLLTDVGETVEDSWKPFLDIPIPVLLLGTSLMCATFALFPKLSSVDRLRPDEVVSWYYRQIVRRGLWAMVSLALFAAAIASATLSAGHAEPEPEDPSISASWTGAGDKATVEATVEIASMPDDATVTTRITGTDASGAEQRVFEGESRPESDGKLKVTAKVGETDAFEKVVVEATVEVGDDKGDSILTLTR